MEIIKSKIDLDLDSRIFTTNDNICFMDIETTGLSRKYNIIYLIGILYYDSSTHSWILEQIFANNPKHELEVLEYSSKLLNKFDKIINYNGTSFDIPFINHRLQHYNFQTKYNIDINKSYDLYRIIRKNKKLFHFENLKLETIEEFLGIFRKDIYSGYECIQFYKDYSKNNSNIKLKDNILQHNYDDLYYLLKVVKILDIIYDLKSFTTNIENQDYSYFIRDFEFKEDFLIARGTIKNRNNQILSLSYFDKDIEFQQKNNKFIFKIQTYKGMVTPDNIGYYIDLKQYNLPISTFSKFNIYNIPSNLVVLKVDKEINHNLSILLIKNIIINILQKII